MGAFSFSGWTFCPHFFIAIFWCFTSCRIFFCNPPLNYFLTKAKMLGMAWNVQKCNKKFSLAKISTPSWKNSRAHLCPQLSTLYAHFCSQSTILSISELMVDLVCFVLWNERSSTSKILHQVFTNNIKNTFVQYKIHVMFTRGFNLIT